MNPKTEVRNLKINEVEALVGITRKNIRFYEAEGLLAPRRNSENGYRDPVIASGGAGDAAHFYEALTKGKADAALAASLFH